MLYSLGLILISIGGILSLPVPVAVYFGELSLIPSFLAPAAVSFGIGYILQDRFEGKEIRFGNAMVIVAITWILLALFGAIPFVLSCDMSFLNSYFESMSGFTATGLTVMQGFQGWVGGAPPFTIMFWRSFTQWIGGLGVIVLFLAVFPGSATVARKLYSSEAREGRIMPTIGGTAKAIWKIYIFFTLLGIVGLFLSGMSPFAAINHSMTGIATGGFTVTPDSYAGYGPLILGVTIFIMVLGGISFSIHQKVLDGNWRALFESAEVRLMTILILIATFALVLGVGFRHSIFETISALTGTGFSSTGIIQGWNSFQKGVLIVLMVLGGGYGSTSSAIKLIRTITILGVVYWLLKRSFLPDRAVVPLEISGKVVSEKDVMETAVYAFIYIMVLTVGSLLTMLAIPQITGVEAVFESASAQGNVGLSVGVTAIATPLVKVLFIIQMLAGRLEILPVAALFGYLVGRLPRRRQPF